MPNSNKVKNYLKKPVKWRLSVGNTSAIYPSLLEYLIPGILHLKFAFN